jgi:hypothetical protein
LSIAIMVFDQFSIFRHIGDPPMKPHDQALDDQKERAIQLAKDRRCSHCGEAIALLEALSMVRGHGYRYSVRIALSDGTTIFMDEADFNPQTMLWDNKNERVGLDGGGKKEELERGVRQ